MRISDWSSDVCSSDLLFGELDLRDITFFGQDWGSLIGLRLVAAQPERFARVVIGNGGMPTGERPPNEAFLSWQTFARTTEHFPVGGDRKSTRLNSSH